MPGICYAARRMVPASDDKVAIEVRTETEVQTGWEYHIRITRPGREATDHQVRLAWVDHDHWSGGTKAPSKVIEAVVEAVLRADPGRELPARFDASTARRWVPTLDETLSRLL